MHLGRCAGELGEAGLRGEPFARDPWTRSGQCRRGEFDLSSNATAHSQSYDVAVIGGGVIGLSIAWRLADSGVSVAVVDDEPGRGVSWAAAGMLAPVTEVQPGEQDLLRLSLESASLWADFAAELAEASRIQPGYRRCGTLCVAANSDQRAELDELHRFQLSLGLEAVRLGPRETRALEPALSPRVQGGILVPGDHQVDNRALVGALTTACERSGVTFERRRATGVALDGDGVAGVSFGDGGTIASRRVVVAAGCWSAALEGLFAGRSLPVRPVKGQLLHLRARGGVQPIRNIKGDHVYVVTRPDGRIVVGATVEEQGFDASVTAGAVLRLLEGAYELLPGIAEAELVETVAGWRPGTPDNLPILGQGRTSGVFFATGHYRNGVLLAPVTAALVSDAVLGRGDSDRLRPFSPDRFGARSGALL